MRYQEIKLTELKMSPGYLAKQAALTQALVEIEYEMYVTDIQSDQSDYPRGDEHIDWNDYERELENFFTQNDNSYSHSQLVGRALVTMTREYEADFWERVELYYRKAQEDQEDISYGEATEHMRDRYPIDEWAESHGLIDYSDFSNEYLQGYWPITKIDVDPESRKSLIRDFQQTVGRELYWADVYHGGPRLDNAYVVEPDGSLDDPSDELDLGLEFISPPLALNDAVRDFESIKRWARRRNYYTNSTTGLHINVSMPGFSLKSINPVKLMLLLGDQRVLAEYGREANRFCKSSLLQVQRHLANNEGPEPIMRILDQLRKQLSSEVIPSSYLYQLITKYSSVYFHNDRVEFRAPGGDWLNQDTDQIINTINRFTVALQAALNPQLEREETAKKLYSFLQQILAPLDQQLGTSRFRQYLSGELSRQEIKDYIARRTDERFWAQARQAHKASQGADQ